MDQNEIIEGMAVEEVTNSRGGILPVILKVAKPVVKSLLAGVGGYMLGRHARKRVDDAVPSEIECADYEYSTDDDSDVDSDVE